MQQLAVRTLLVLSALVLPAVFSWSQTSSCRGTGVFGSGSSTQLLCTGTCDQGTCDTRNGTGSFTSYKICACENGDAPNSCCGLALKRVGSGSSATFEVVKVGDCIGCDFTDRTCTVIGEGDNREASCVESVPPTPL